MKEFMQDITLGIQAVAYWPEENEIKQEEAEAEG
jgi:hypothetical protein